MYFVNRFLTGVINPALGIPCAVNAKELDTDKYVTEQIEKAVVGLDRKNKNIVMARLRDGKITTDNLGACLDRITELKKV